MNRPFLVRRALLVGAAALVTLAGATACAATTGVDQGPGQPTTSASSGAAFVDADVMFVQMMIPHHQQAVDMAALAETRASDPELKLLAAKIKAAQDPEITTMTAWLTAWGQPSAAAGGHLGHGGMPGVMSAEEMTQLAAAKGVDFDRMFARMMIAHHAGAIQMASDEEANGVNRNAKALAAQIMKTQYAEIEALQKILDRL